MKRIRLSTLMLLVVIAALAVALLVQEQKRRRREAEFQALLALQRVMEADRQMAERKMAALEEAHDKIEKDYIGLSNRLNMLSKMFHDRDQTSMGAAGSGADVRGNGKD